MSGRMFPKGLEAFSDKQVDWNTDTIKCLMLTAVSDTSLKIITGATNANPSVLTSTSHGLTVNDIVCVGKVGGNLSVNGVFKVNTVPDANTFTLKTLRDGLVVQGSGAYTSGGFLLNLTTATNRADIDAGQLGTAQTLGSPTLVNGELDAADVSFTSVTGAEVIGAFIYRDAGAAASDRLLVWHDGRIQVVAAADAATSATTLWVEPIDGPIPSGTAIVFSNGVTATLSSGAAAGARSLAVSALAAGITAGHQADAPTTSNGLPVTPNGGNISFTWGAYIAKL